MAQKVTISREFNARLSHAATGKLCQPSRKWVPFSKRDELCLSSAVPKIQWDS